MDTTWQVPGHVLGREAARDELGIVVPGVSLARGESVLVRVVTGPERQEHDDLDRLTGLEMDHLVPLIDVLPAADTGGLDGSPGVATGWGGARGDEVAAALVYRDLEGTPLAELVGAGESLSVGEAVGVFEPIARALAGLHALGLRHGFVRTGSIVIDADGVPWLAAVGASQAAGWTGALHDDVAELAHLVTTTSALRVEPDALADADALAGHLAAAGEPRRLRRGGSSETPFDLAGRMRAAAREPLPGDPEEPPAATSRTGRRSGGHPGRRDGGAGVGRGRAPGSRARGLARGRRARVRVRALRGRVRGRLGRDGAGWVGTLLGGRGPRRGRHTAAGPGLPATRRALAGGAAAVALILGWIVALTFIRPGAPPPSGVDSTSAPAAPGASSPSGTAGGSTKATEPTSRAGATEPRKGDGDGAGQPGGPHGAVAGVLGDPNAPQTDPVALIQALADLRARAWRTLDLGLLAQLNAPDSAALSADRAVVRRAASQELRYRDLEFTVSSATPRADGPGAGTVQIDAVIAAGPYAVVPAGAGAAAVPVPADPSRPVTLTLTWTGWRWQVADVASTPTGSAG